MSGHRCLSKAVHTTAIHSVAGRHRNEDPSQAFIMHPKDTPAVRSAVEFFNCHGITDFCVQIGPISGWRTVSKLAVRSSNQDIEGYKMNTDKKARFRVPLIGLFRPGTHNVVPCSATSLAHHPAINDAVQIVRKACVECKLFGYIEGKGADQGNCEAAGFLKYLVLAVDRCSSQVQLSLVWNTTPPYTTKDRPHLLSAADACPRISDKKLALFTDTLLNIAEKFPSSCTTSPNFFHSIWVNYHPSSSSVNTITGRGGPDTWSLLYGSSCIVERIKTDTPEMSRFSVDLYLPPFVFRQANLDQFTVIINSIRSILRRISRIEEHNENWQSNAAFQKVVEGKTKSDEIKEKLYCMELYGGVGTIGLNCLDLLEVLRCSDENPYNKIYFEKALEGIPIEFSRRASYLSANAETAVRELFDSRGWEGYNICIADPPRKGLSTAVLNALLRKPIGNERYLKYFIYVSCGLASLIRDTKVLLGETRENAIINPVDNKNQTTGTKNYHKYIWTLMHAEGHVLFPGSDHIETLAVFSRR